MVRHLELAKVANRVSSKYKERVWSRVSVASNIIVNELKAFYMGVRMFKALYSTRTTLLNIHVGNMCVFWLWSSAYKFGP